MTIPARARACALTLVLAVLTGCAAGDADGAPFNADGTAADLDALAGTYRTPAVQSFGASRTWIDRALGAPIVAPATELAAARSRRDFGARARVFAFEARSAADRSASAAARLPDHVLGATFGWDPRQARYVATRRPGAPADGVRFVLYAIDPASRRPAQPLRPVGHVDLIDGRASGDEALHLRVAGDATTWLDYSVRTERAERRATLALQGFATNGVDRVTFAVSADVALDDSPEAGRIDYRLSVPSRDLALQWTVALGGLRSPADPMSLDLALSSSDGSVILEGAVAGGTGALHALANNVPVSTVALSANGVSLARPDGAALEPAEDRALRRVLTSVEEMSGWSATLLGPVASLM